MLKFKSKGVVHYEKVFICYCRFDGGVGRG